MRYTTWIILLTGISTYVSVTGQTDNANTASSNNEQSLGRYQTSPTTGASPSSSAKTQASRISPTSQNGTVNTTDSIRGTVTAAYYTSSDADKLLQVLLNRCPYINSYQKPVRNQLDTIGVYVLLTLDRFLDIEEETETFGIAGTFTVCWNYPPCASWNGDEQFKNVQWLYVPLKNTSSGVERWIPTIRLLNGAVDSRAITHMAQDMGYLYINAAGQGCIEPYGQVKMTCPPLAYNLVKFPFDQQTCAIELGRQANDPTIAFQNAGFDIAEGVDANSSDTILGKNKTLRLQVLVPDDFIEPSSVWELIDIGYDGSDSKMSYQFAFRRRPKAAMYSIILPAVLLMLLQLFVYAIPPQYPERPIYSITVVLSFYILQTVLVDGIPQSSITLLIVDYLACQLCLGVFVTLYTCIATHFGHMYKNHPIILFKPKQRGENRQPSQRQPTDEVPETGSSSDEGEEHHEGGIDAVRFADCIAAFATMLVMAIYNGYVFSQLLATVPDPVLSWGNSE